MSRQILIAFILVLTCVTVTSCGNGDNKVMSIVPVYGYKYSNSNPDVVVPEYCYTPTHPHYTIKTESGELVEFDNEGDYMEYCLPVECINFVWKEYYRSKRKGIFQHFGIPNIYTDDADMDISQRVNYYAVNPGKIKVLGDTIQSIYSEIIQAVALYMDGKQDKIENREIAELIEKFKYDKHPSQDDYYLDSEKNNAKYYASSNEKLTGANARKVKDDEQYITVSGEKLKSGAIIMYPFNANAFMKLLGF